MAGSLRWFVYQLDNGSRVGVFLDESNTEALNGGAANIPPAGQRPTVQRPVGTKLRTITYKTPDGLRSVRVVALTPTIYNSIPASLSSIPNPLPASGNTGSGALQFWDKSPERLKIPRFGLDTGLTDGDSPN